MIQVPDTARLHTFATNEAARSLLSSIVKITSLHTHDDQLPLVSVPDATTATHFEVVYGEQRHDVSIDVSHQIPKSDRMTECTVYFVSDVSHQIQVRPKSGRSAECTVCKYFRPKESVFIIMGDEGTRTPPHPIHIRGGPTTIHEILGLRDSQYNTRG